MQNMHTSSKQLARQIHVRQMYANLVTDSNHVIISNK